MAVFSSPFDTLLGLQQALDAFRTSGWLDEAGPSGGGGYPPVNVFRKGDDFAIVAEVPGVKRADLVYAEYGVGHWARSFSLSDKVDRERIGAQLEDGVLTLTLPKTAEARPRRIAVG